VNGVCCIVKKEVLTANEREWTQNIEERRSNRKERKKHKEEGLLLLI